MTPYSGNPPDRAVAPTAQISPLKIIFDKRDNAELVRFAEKKGKELSSADLSTSQIRNVLDAIQMMTKFDRNELELLRPKLAYAAGKKFNLRPFRDILDEAIGYVRDDLDFKLFRNLVEAIVAYHALAESDRRQERRH